MTAQAKKRRWMEAAIATAAKAPANLPYTRATRPARAAKNVAEAPRKRA